MLKFNLISNLPRFLSKFEIRNIIIIVLFNLQSITVIFYLIFPFLQTIGIKDKTKYKIDKKTMLPI